MPFVDRTTFIELLDKLRHDDDTEVLAAAKEINRRMDEGGVSWEEVLVGGAQDADDEDDFHDDFDDADDDDTEDAPVDVSGDTALIEKLLARDDLSEETREELEDYKEDIAEGEFSASDSRYLQALAKRIGG